MGRSLVRERARPAASRPPRHEWGAASSASAPLRPSGSPLHKGGGHMRLEAVEMRRIEMSLVAPFETSFGIQTERDILLVKAITSEGEGWGECVAGEEPTYSSEYVEAAQHVLIHHLIPRLLGRELEAADVSAELRPVHGHHMAKAAIEMAVLDAELRARGESFGHFFGGVRREVDCDVLGGNYSHIVRLT